MPTDDRARAPRKQRARASAAGVPPGPSYVRPSESSGLPPTGRKRAEVLASQIEREIVQLGWPVGTVLGSEPDLLERYQVSRAVFREAMRLLEHHHIAEMRRGRKGGLTVIKPDATSLTDATALYLQYHRVDPAHLFEARQSVEITCVKLAADRASEDDISRLRELAQVVPASTEELASNSADFHIAIAEASRNPALHLFVQVLYTLTEATLDHGPVMPLVAEVHHVHAAIVEAIAAGDAALAQRRMLRHFEAMTSVEGLTEHREAT